MSIPKRIKKKAAKKKPVIAIPTQFNKYIAAKKKAVKKKKVKKKKVKKKDKSRPYYIVLHNLEIKKMKGGLADLAMEINDDNLALKSKKKKYDLLLDRIVAMINTKPEPSLYDAEELKDFQCRECGIYAESDVEFVENDLCKPCADGAEEARKIEAQGKTDTSDDHPGKVEDDNVQKTIKFPQEE